MESNNDPKRVVLRFHVRHELEEAAINEQFFALYYPEPPKNDFYSHLMAPNESSKMHIVLDLHCKSHPTIDNSKIAYEVFKVEKKDEFEFEKLHGAACKFARVRCERIKWGTDRSQSEELDGDQPRMPLNAQSALLKILHDNFSHPTTVALYWTLKKTLSFGLREELITVSSTTSSDQEKRKWRDPTPEVYYPSPWETELDRAKGSAQNAAQLLARYPTGKSLLEAEGPEGSSATDPEYWRSKEKLYKACYKAEYQETELERAKRRSDDVARDLATFPAGKALLDAEDQRDAATDPEHWRSKERFYKAEKERLTQEFWDHWKRFHLEGSGSPAKTSKILGAEKPCMVECRKAGLNRAKRCADNAAQFSTHFAAGKALLEAEDHGESATDPVYWWSKEKFYAAERWKLEQEFWDCWKRTHLEGGVVACEAPNDSKQKTRARQSPIAKESRTTRSTRSATERRKETNRVHLEATTGRTISYADSDKSIDVHSMGRRKGKNNYRRQKASVVSRKPALPAPGCSATEQPLYDYMTPNPDHSRTPPAAITERPKASARKRRRKVTDPDANRRPRKSPPQTHSPHVTPSSSDLAKSKAQQRRTHKGAVRKRRQAADRAYRGSKAGSQSIEPISSRLRSNTYPHQS